jgi:predicted small secreted protein
MKWVARVTAWTLLATLVLSSALACNTFRGMGRDIEKGGRTIQEVGK